MAYGSFIAYLSVHFFKVDILKYLTLRIYHFILGIILILNVLYGFLNVFWQSHCYIYLMWIAVWEPIIQSYVASLSDGLKWIITATSVHLPDLLEFLSRFSVRITTGTENDEDDELNANETEDEEEEELNLDLETFGATYPSHPSSDADVGNCPVCLERIVPTAPVRRLGCTHTFHVNCIDNWFELHNTCPVCRQFIL